MRQHRRRIAWDPGATNHCGGLDDLVATCGLGNKGGPGTAQGIHAMADEVEHEGGFLGKLLVHGAPAVAGHLLGGEVGALAGLFGSQTIGAARAAGLRKIDDLVDRALLDPQFARTLAMKAPDRPNSGADTAMRFQFGRIGRATALGLAAGQPAGSEQQHVAAR